MSKRADTVGIVGAGSFGTALGSVLAGQVVEAYTVGGTHDWSTIWLIPCVLAAAVAVLFAVLFRDRTVDER